MKKKKKKTLTKEGGCRLLKKTTMSLRFRAVLTQVIYSKLIAAFMFDVLTLFDREKKRESYLIIMEKEYIHRRLFSLRDP